MFGIEGIEAVKFAPGVLGVEPPVDDGSGGISLRDQGLDLPPEGRFVGDALLEAGADSTLNSISAIFNQLPCLGV